MTSTQQVEQVLLDHGTGAGLSRELLEFVFGVLGDVSVGEGEDSASLVLDTPHIAVTTDSFVVDPPFFGNGDIGKIAVCGTVNDLTVVGAEPLYLTLAMVLETGLPLSRLRRLLESVRDTAREAGVTIVAGDTKVVRPGEADGVYLNTTGVGVLRRTPMRMRDVRPGDRIVLSGRIGDHTVHLLSIREGLGFEEKVLSDCAPLNGLVSDLFAELGTDVVRSMRDVTRGGLTGVLHEYSAALGRELEIEQAALPIAFETRMAMDMLGIDPLNAANEGCLCLFVAPESADDVVRTLRRHRYGHDATVIGTVLDVAGPRVTVISADGHRAELEELRGAELPRLC